MRQTTRSISGVLFLLLSNPACVVEISDDDIGDDVDDTSEDTSSSSTGSTSEESTSEESTSESTSEETEETTESTSEESTSEETEETTESTSEESTSEETEESTESTSEDATETETETETETQDTFDTFFVPEGDIGGDACDPFAQDCPDGEKCVAYSMQGGSWDANKCVPVLGNQAVGDACVSDGIMEGTDNCDANGFCFFEVCTGFCGGSPFDPECPPEFGCVQSNESLNACMQQCDPLVQDCAAGQGCYFVPDQFLCLPTAGDIPAGEPCGFLNDCASGSNCIDASLVPNCAGPACCSPFCDLQGVDGCAVVPGTVCGEFTPEVGICLLF
jgi:hypothetical protein